MFERNNDSSDGDTSSSSHAFSWLADSLLKPLKHLQSSSTASTPHPLRSLEEEDKGIVHINQRFRRMICRLLKQSARATQCGTQPPPPPPSPSLPPPPTSRPIASFRSLERRRHVSDIEGRLLLLRNNVYLLRSELVQALQGRLPSFRERIKTDHRRDFPHPH